MGNRRRLIWPILHPYPRHCREGNREQQQLNQYLWAQPCPLSREFLTCYYIHGESTRYWFNHRLSFFKPLRRCEPIQEFHNLPLRHNDRIILHLFNTDLRWILRRARINHAVSLRHKCCCLHPRNEILGFQSHRERLRSTDYQLCESFHDWCSDVNFCNDSS